MKSEKEIKEFINSKAGMEWQMNTDEGFKCTIKGADAMEKAISGAKAQLGDVVGAFVGGMKGRLAAVAAVEECAVSTLSRPLPSPTDNLDTERGTAAVAKKRY